MSIVILGSINMDMVSRVAESPAAGQTVTGESVDTTPGGKDANQAVAAAIAITRHGAQQAMLTKTEIEKLSEILFVII